MLQVARLAPRHLGSAVERVGSFLRGKLHPCGGGVDRAGEPDLYYTVFVLDGLIALGAGPPVVADVPAVRGYLEGFGDGADLDFVHLCCLARCWAGLGQRPGDPAAMAAHLGRFRSGDGGFHPEPGARAGTAYHAFLGLGAHQDLGVVCPGTSALADSVARLASADGGYANTAGMPAGSTTASAAAVTLLRQLGRAPRQGIAEWLLARVHPESGGFLAAPEAPLPDLLSTATALHALAGMQVDVAAVRERCLDFLDSLWTGQAFCGHWAEDVTDAEYTFYALLALGHLSL